MRLMRGAEPFEFAGQGPAGALLIHGFTGSPAEMRPLGEHLASIGVPSIGVRLAGHGTHPNDMLRYTYRDWIADAERGYERLAERCERVYLVGLSMGGTIGLYLAARHAEDPRLGGVVPICAPIRLADVRLRLLPVLVHLVRWKAWGRPDILDQSAWDRWVGYRRFRTASLAQLLALMRVTRPLLPRVACPALVVQARLDHLVPPANAIWIYRSIGSRDKRLLWLDDCYHVATLDFAAGRLNTEVATFVQTGVARRFDSPPGPAKRGDEVA